LESVISSPGRLKGGANGKMAVMALWTLIAAEHRLPPGGAVLAHRVLAVIDQGGRCVRQFNGLASALETASNSWRCKPIGFAPSDRLRIYDTAVDPHTWLSMHGARAGCHDMNQAILRGNAASLAGPLNEGELKSYLAVLCRTLSVINARSPGPSGGGGVSYPFLGLGPNSNSAFATLVAAMGLTCPALPRGAWLAPGLGRILLPYDELRSIAGSLHVRSSRS
jgi:hypothetical protein